MTAAKSKKGAPTITAETITATLTRYLNRAAINHALCPRIVNAPTPLSFLSLYTRYRDRTARPALAN